MIPEIGLVIGLYVLTRIIPTTRRRLYSVVAWVTAVVTILVLIDLLIQGFGGTGTLQRLTSKLAARPTPTAATEARKPEPTGPASTVTRASGGSVQTVLGYGIVLNKASSMNREWIVVHDPRVPADIEGTAGVVTAYKREEYSGQYVYRATLKLKTSAAIAAYELRFLTFNIWGQHVQTLSATSVEDIAANSQKDLAPYWRLFSENEAEEYYASIGYVARVRLSDGRVVEADPAPVVEAAKKFSAKFAPEDLEPKPASPPPTPGKG